MIALLLGVALAQDAAVQVMQDLQPGKPIPREALRVVDVAPGALPFEPVRDLDAVVGREPRERIFATEFLRDDRLSAPEMHTATEYERLVPRGHRAIDVVPASYDPPVTPGMVVDVVWRRHGQTGPGCRLVQLAYVVGLRSDGGSIDVRTPPVAYRAVVLSAPAADVLQIEAGRATGDVWLALRPDGDVMRIGQTACTDPPAPRAP